MKEPGKFEFLVRVELHKSFDRLFFDHGIKEKLLKESFAEHKLKDSPAWLEFKKELDELTEKIKSELNASVE